MRNLAIASSVSLALLLPVTVRGEEAPQPPAGGAPAAAPDLSVRPPPALDFSLLDAPPGERPADRKIEAAVARRRTLLQTHQAAGLGTWALLAATVVYGRLDYQDRYHGDDTGKYATEHRTLGYVTAATYAFTGSMAALAPVPYPKRARFDTVTAHKISMGLTTLGMLTQIGLGLGMRNGWGNERDLARVHQGVGYGTLATMTAGAITLTF